MNAWQGLLETAGFRLAAPPRVEGAYVQFVVCAATAAPVLLALAHGDDVRCVGWSERAGVVTVTVTRVEARRGWRRWLRKGARA